MHPKRDLIIRPLLDISHRDILLYLSENGISYCTDETNLDERYARNRIRNRLLPELKEIQPGCVEHMAKAAEELREVEAYIERQAVPVYERLVTKSAGVIRLNTESFSAIEPVIQKELILMAIGEIVPGKKDVLRRHIESIVNLAAKENGKGLHLPKGITVTKSDSCLLFQTGTGNITEETPDGKWILYDKEEQEITHDLVISTDLLLKMRIFPYQKGLLRFRIQPSHIY